MWRKRGYDYDHRDYGARDERFDNRYPGGRGGYSSGRGMNGYDREMRGRYGRDQDRPYSYDRDFAPRGRMQRYGGDYWWIGEREFRGRGRPGPYDDAYRRFSEEHHPRFSPVGGMYPPVGGRYATEGPPRPLREYSHFSDWTRWF